MPKPIIALILLIFVGVLGFTESQPGNAQLVAPAFKTKRRALETAGQMAAGVSSTNFELVGQAGGVSRDLAVQGHFAYLGQGPRLVVLDIIEPANPAYVGQSPILPGVVAELALNCCYAYVAAGSGGLQIVDIANPANPVTVGALEITATDVVVNGDYLYAATATGVLVYDLHDPAAPVEIGRFDGNGAEDRLAVFGETVCILAWEDSDYGEVHLFMSIVEISDPSHPSEIAAYDWWNDDYAYALSAVEPYVYVSNDSAFTIYDLSDPSVPTITGIYNPPGSNPNIVELTVSDQYVLLATYLGLDIVDVSDPATPVKVGSWLSEDTPYAVQALNGTAYLALDSSGMRTIDITDPGAPGPVGFYHTFGRVQDVESDGVDLYIASQTYGGSYYSYVWLTEAYLVPARLSFVRNYGIEQALTIAGPRAASANSNAGLFLMDLADRSAPFRAGRWAQMVQDVAMIGNYALTTGYDGSISQISVLDLSNPALPTLVTTIPAPAGKSVAEIAVQGEIAYAGGGPGYFLVLDVSDPAHPAVLRIDDTLDSVIDMQIDGTNLYLLNAIPGGGSYTSIALRVFDISSPANPTQIGALPLEEGASLDVSGGYAFIAPFWPGQLRVVDVSNPISMTEVDRLDTTDQFLDVKVKEPFVYAANDEGGLLVYLFRPFYTTTQTTFFPVVGNDHQDPALRLALSFDEPVSSSRFADSTHYRNAGVCVGTACPTAGMIGVTGAALHFDGFDDIVTLGDPCSLDFHGEITMEAWIIPEATDGMRNILAHGYARAPDAEVYLRINNGAYEAGVWNGAGHKVSLPIPAEDLGAWVHLVGVYDGETWRLYRNGKEVGAVADPVGAIPVNAGWAVGAAGNGGERFFQGTIDAVTVYNRALSAETIRLRYAQAMAVAVQIQSP